MTAIAAGTTEMQMPTTVLVEHDEQARIATVTLNRPEKRNALSLALMGELIDVLRDLGVPAEVHTGAMRGGRWSRLVCFGGLGPGEVVVGGRKLVGISQRRTRAVARFQCVVHRRWDPGPLLGLLALDPADRIEAGGLADLAVGLDRPFDEVIGAFVRHLPDESG